MKRKLSLVWVLALIITILSACGGQAKSDSTSEEPAAAGDVQQVDPNAKIASMSIHMTNNLLALGIKPAGSAIGGGVGDFLPHVKDMLQGTVKLGVVTEPDIEAVLALKPDYIFIEEQFGGQDRAKLEKIAPIVSMDLDKGTWRDQLKQVAAVVGKSKEADEFVKAYDEKTERVRKLISDELGSSAKVMAIRVSAKELRVMSTSRPVGPIMFEDLQLTPANGVEKIADGEPYEVISKEVLPDFDADAIFLIVNDDDNAKKAFNELEKNPLWENLKAVKNNHVYTLDGQKWLDYSSLGQSMAMDDMEQLLTKK
jgi:ABC-type Fe3+-hydroxamate transport system, periplasmic component